MRRLGELHDPEWGGFGARAPKFPPASALELLLRRGEAELAVPTLDAMAAGGMYDLVGGGFHRYSVDERWLVPHFEKMLYDNALLVPAYLHGWLVTGRERYREVVEETVEYLLRDLRLPDGGFASSQDADTDGVEGLTYTWAPGRGRARGAASSRSRTAASSCAARSTRRRGRGCWRCAPSGRSRGSTTRRSPRGTGSRWRRWPRRGAGSSGRTGSTRRGRSASSCSGRCRVEGRLVRSLREGKASGPGFLDDYANVAHGLYELHVATGELRWLEESRRLALLAVELFADDEHGGFFLAPAEGEQLVARRKELYDHPVPSGNSMLAYVLLRLARIYGDDELERRAVGVLRLFGESLGRGPTEFAWALNALDLYLATPRELAIVGPPDERRGARGARAVRPEHRRRLRPGGGRAAARGQGPRGRQARGLRLRALRLPGAAPFRPS